MIVPVMFGQDAIKEAMRRCGGKGTKAQILNEVTKMGASASLSKTFGRAINKLHDKREVDKLFEQGQWWYILTGE